MRQPCSMPQSGWMSGIEQVLGPPDRVILGQRPELVFLARGRSRSSTAEALVELRARRSRPRRRGSRPARRTRGGSAWPRPENSGTSMAVEEDDRRLEQVLRRVAVPGSTTCQVSRFFQSRETTPTRLRMSSGSLFQSPPGPWRSLLIRTGARPLARNRSAKLVARTGSCLDRARPARTRRACLARGPAPRPPRDTSRARRRTACPVSRPARSRP